MILMLTWALAASAPPCPSFMFDPNTQQTTCLKERKGPASPKGSKGWLAYQRFLPMAEALAIKAGNANAIEMCGIQSPGWYERISKMHGQAELSLINDLALADRAVGEQFMSQRSRKQTEWVLGGKEISATACHDLAQKPFVYNWASFVP